MTGEQFMTGERSMTGEGRRISRRVLVILVAVVVVGGLVVGGVVLFGTKAPVKAAGVDNAATTSTATIAQRSLSAQTNVNATLGYAGSYSVINQAVGNFSQLPSVGDVIEPGEVLYAVGGQPVVLLAGSTPAYRTMVAGVSGPDVQELNADMVALGYAPATLQGPVFSAVTAAAVIKLQAHLGVTQTGVLTVDDVVFLPSAARITAVSATLGATAQAGATIATATSTTRQVVVALDATEQASVKVGDPVTITLPDTSTTPGVVATVGTVATAPAGGAQGQNSTPTIEVDVTPTDPTATGSLDQAPVLVAITTASVTDALVVPVAALLAVAGGGYAVEVVAADGTHQLVGVTLGLFDDADGLVQITGSAVHAGSRVVVPGS
ncbi:MAG TPA: peptidoglycan-binding domain-containing protein [Acidothermaceae bacterium]|jgi:peptidoglycan hydrolase-like protein with peptidoglycan-binding domain